VSREELTTDKFAVDFYVRSRFFDIRVTIGSTRVHRSEDKSFCFVVAVNIELFHNCQGAIGFRVLVALDV